MNQETVDSKPFSFIKKFIDAIAEQFGEKHRPATLYSHLLSKITDEHPVAITKNVDAFRTFAVDNRDAIYAKDISKIPNPRISYSDKVYIDLGEVFELAKDDEKTQKVMWIHILLISAVVDPTGKAKQVLAENPEKKENQFMTGVLDKVEKAVPKDSTPQEAFSSIMSSGIFTDIMGSMTKGLDSGELDIKSLLGTATSAMKGIKGGDSSDMPDMSKIIEDMMGGEGGDKPDLNKLMGDMMKGLGGAEGDAPPDLGKMVGEVMKGLDGGGGDLGAMMSNVMKGLGGEEGGPVPDLSKMMNGGTPDLNAMMGSMMNGNKTNPSNGGDVSGLPDVPLPPGGDPLKMMASMLGAPSLPKSKPPDLSRLAPPDTDTDKNN